MEPEATAIQKIQDNGNRPEDWLEFLSKQRTKSGPDLSTETCQHLIFLYERAVTQISAEDNKKNFCYARLLVECAKLQMRISEDDARRTFQLARSNAKHFAIVFVAWAQFELLLGNKSKCRGLLRKGKDFEAEPKELLLKAYDNFVEGKKILIDDREELTGFTYFRGKQKSSDSSVDSSPLSTGEDTSTSSRFTDSGSAKFADNTSAVISFKLPSILESCRRQPLSSRRSISSSSDEADTIPFQKGHFSHLQRGCQSTQKASVKSTPDVKSGSNSLAASMNLSVRRNKTRRDFGLPVRVKMTLPSVKEPGDDLDGISALELTVDESQQNSHPEMISAGQETAPTNGIICVASTDHTADRKVDEKPPTGKSLHPTKTQNQFKGKQDEFEESVFTSQTQGNQLPSQQPNNTLQEGSQTIPTNPLSATLNNGSRTQNDHSSHRQTFPIQQIPTPQGSTALISSSSIGSSVLQRPNSGSMPPNLGDSGSFIQHPIPQVNHSGQLQAIPGQLRGNSFASAFTPEMHFVNPMMPIAPKAPQGIIVVNGKTYQKLGTIGKGGSSKVYQVYDGKRICALKYVNLEEADDFIVQSYVNEINLLKRLQGNDNIIKLFDWELSQEKSAIILVMECGSIDLAGFLRKNRNKMSRGELQGFWRQMLEAVHVVHQQGIIHSDLKPANFLLVEARLKLIDFGIARTLQCCLTAVGGLVYRLKRHMQIIANHIVIKLGSNSFFNEFGNILEIGHWTKVRNLRGDKTSIELDTQVGTLNFMSPEAFQDISPRFDKTGNAKPKMKIGRPSDVWSLGCILYMMVYGRTPFQHITNHLQKLQCIMDPSHVIEFPDINDKHLLDVIEGCLRRSPKERYTIPQLLAHPFINSSAQGNTSSFSDPSVEIDSDRMFDCLMEFAKADVNSPRSIRALSQSFLKQLRAGNKISVSSAVPGRHHIHVNSQHAVPSIQVPGPALRQPLAGIDVQALSQAHNALKPPHVSGNDKYMRWNTIERDKENADLNAVLKRELAEKYRNAVPADMSESTFEQSWNTTTGR